jgi:DUF971 family protein
MKYIKNCKIHGTTEFVHYSNGKVPRDRCKKCQVEAVSKRRRKLKILAIEYKGGKCIKCGFNDINYIGVFEFHHIDPMEKDFSISVDGCSRA